eukprot:3036846-Amphidinium_carterae.3
MLSLAAVYDDAHPFRHIPVVEAMRVLGWWVGAGPDHELDSCALDCMRGRIPRLHDSCFGLVGNQFLLERGIFTVASHVLRTACGSGKRCSTRSS